MILAAAAAPRPRVIQAEGSLVGQDVAADHRHDPVHHDGQRDRGDRVRGDRPRAGHVGGRHVHVRRRGGAGQDQGPLGPGGLARPGQAEREQREHDHQQVQQQRLDHAGRVLAADGEDVGVLGGERDEQRAAADQRQQPRRHGDQHRAGGVSGPGPAVHGGVEPLAGRGSDRLMTAPARSASRDRTRLTDVRARPNARPIAAWCTRRRPAAAIASSRSRRAALTCRVRSARRSRSVRPPQMPCMIPWLRA